jgi:hypothetical protein
MVAAVVGVLGLVSALFAALLFVSELGGGRETILVSVYLFILAVVAALAPAYLIDPCEYVVTDRRVLWRRGGVRRSIERAGITFARIRWHRSSPGVGQLELVRAVPFGPLARRQRLVLHDIKAPDLVYGLIRGAEPSPNGGVQDVPMVDRLDPGETVVWGGHPEGRLVGWREVVTAVLGGLVVGVGVRYGMEVLRILLGLEDLGLQVKSWTWLLLFSAVAITWGLLITTGCALLWYGIVRARALGRDTEYLLTDRRLLIRRGPTELSLDRKRIVDVADAPASGGLYNLFLVLDAPHSRALADSGALRTVTPARDSVPPILYEVSDVEGVKSLILARSSRPSLPPVPDAA